MAARGAEVAGLDLSGTLEPGLGESEPRPSGGGNEAQVLGSPKLSPAEAAAPTGPVSSAASVTPNGELEAAEEPEPRAAAGAPEEAPEGAPELGVAGAGTEGQLLGKIKVFQDQREEERRRMFRIIVWLALRVFCASAMAIGVGTALRYALPESHVPGAIITLGFATFVFGIIVGSSCPYDLLDLEDLCRKSPKSMGLWISFSSVVNVLQVRYFPHLDAVKLSCMLLMGVGIFSGACGLRPPRWWPTITAAMAWYFAFDGISWAGIFFFHDQNDWLAIPETPSRVLGCINFFYGFTAFVAWFWHRRRYAHLAHGDSRRFYKVLYYWAVAFGIRWGFYGAAQIAAPLEGTEDAVAGALEIVRGLSTMLPSLAVMAVGRERFFETVGHSFDKDGARLRRDGAFVAELLESIPIQVGQTWWVHREVENENYPRFDPRRCWQKGVVTEMANQSDFAVRIQEPRFSGRRTSMRRSTASNSSNEVATLRMKLPVASKGESKEDLLLRAQSDLRCVEFENLSPDLMYRVDSRNKPELQAAWHALSRPVRRGEKIDYFMSNSWYDDPDAKWQRLVDVAEAFQRRHGRYPTFWLDKLCIDQQKITDGLKVLPVNVMACTKLLALCGDTYLSRLWCIWELFTLFAFVSEAAALNRVEFVFLGTHEAGMKMLDGMEHFHVNTAHCYDPNEEARLLQVIEAVGTARFNKRVSNMASMTKARLLKMEKTKSEKSSVVRATSSMSRGWGHNKSTASGRSTGSDAGTASDPTADGVVM